MSLLTNFQDLAKSIKLALDRKADRADIPQIPDGTAEGDILVWNGSTWEAKQPTTEQ